MQPIVALLTDFGTIDSYVGVMKGVMLGIRSSIRFIDISHAIQPQNIRQAAFTLLNAYRYFPPGTIFLVVVDPAVGSARRPLVASADGYLFVAPDNGVLSYVLAECRNVTLIEPTEAMYMLQQVSSTFHGRDVFAPLAAHLAADTPLQAMGLVLTDPVTLAAPALDVSEPRVRGEVLHIDHFGNAVTSIGTLRWLDSHLQLTPRFGQQGAVLRFDAEHASVRVREVTLPGIHRTYAEAEGDGLLAMVGSSGFLEIAQNHGSAANRLGLVLGDAVEIMMP